MSESNNKSNNGATNNKNNNNISYNNHPEKVQKQEQELEQEEIEVNEEEVKNEEGDKEIAEAAKISAKVAASAATGNMAGAAKDTIQYATKQLINKKKIKRTAITIIAILCIFLAIAGFFLGIFDAVGNTVQGIIDGIIGFFTTDETDGSIDVSDEQIDQIINAIEDLGVSVEDLKLLGDYSEEATPEEQEAELKKYIRKFYEAQAVTQTLNYFHTPSTDTETFGAIYVYRTNGGENIAEGNRTNLTYIPYEQMQQMVEESNTQALNHFSIDASGNLVYVGSTRNIVEVGSSESNLSVQSDVTTLQMQSIDYKSAVAQYTTQMNFLLYLTMISQNPEFVSAVVDLIKDSRIEITILDSITTNVNTETYTYTLHTKTRTETTDEDTGEVTVTYPERTSNETEITRTTTITTIPTPKVTYVKTWFCEQTITYNRKVTMTEDNYDIEPKPEDENEPAGEGSWRTDQNRHINTSMENVSYEEGVRGDVKITLGQSGDAERYENGEISQPTFVGLMETDFRIPYSTRTEEAGSNLVSGAEMLFYLLQKDPNLENMETLMRYALYLYSGRDFGVTSIDGSIFEIEDFFTVTTNGAMNLANYLRQFSHSSEAPKSTDGKFYLMYGDGAGWPTIGNADIQWASHYTKFAVSGRVLENGEEKEVQDVAAYVNAKLGRGPTAQYTNEEIESLQIYIEVELVDSIGQSIVENYYTATQRYTAGLDLSTQQMYALTSIYYNFGKLPTRNGKTFVQVYTEGEEQFGKNTWQQNRYIWDNWWSALGGGQPGHIPSRDASFETYVKGVFDFDNSPAGQVFSRNYYIYYTQEQLAQFDYAPNFRVTRTSVNEEEIFTYEANAGGSLLEAADKLHQDQITWNYSVGGDLYWNNIEMSINNPNKVTCCATYVSSALYLAGYFSEEQINSFNYNYADALYNFLIMNNWVLINNYDDLAAGDIVFMDTNGGSRDINHVQIYAGDGTWYNAGNNNAIHSAAPYRSNERSTFYVGVRPN